MLDAASHTALRHALKHDGPDCVLPQLRAVVASQPATPTLTTALAYLETRVAQLQYPQFRADGWPIGSGMVESANKRVVEDRLKGAGMHWAVGNVNPVLALRNAVCSDRWDAAWAVIAHEQRRQILVRRQPRPAQPVAVPPVAPAAAPPSVMSPVPPPVMPEADTPIAKPPHPWRRAWSVRRQRELANAA